MILNEHIKAWLTLSQAQNKNSKDSSYLNSPKPSPAEPTSQEHLEKGRSERVKNRRSVNVTVPSEGDLLSQNDEGTSNKQGSFLPAIRDHIDHWLEYSGVPDPKFPPLTSQKKPSIAIDDHTSGKGSISIRRIQSMSGIETISDAVPSESASQRRPIQPINNSMLLAKRYSENRLPSDPTSQELGLGITPQCSSDGSPIQASNVAPLEPFAIEADPGVVVGDGTSEDPGHIRSCDWQPVTLTEANFANLRSSISQNGEYPNFHDFTNSQQQLQVSGAKKLGSIQDRTESQTPLVPSTFNRLSGVEKIKNAAKDLKTTIRRRKSRSS